MNIVRTGILMAAMTGLFLAAGFLLGGQTGMLIAFLIALLRFESTKKTVFSEHSSPIDLGKTLLDVQPLTQKGERLSWCCTTHLCVHSRRIGSDGRYERYSRSSAVRSRGETPSPRCRVPSRIASARVTMDPPPGVVPPVLMGNGRPEFSTRCST